MKISEIVVILFSLIFSSKLSGQEYQPLLGETNEWNVVTEVHEGVETYSFFANRDTVIGSKLYKILEEYDYSRYNYITHQWQYFDTLIHGFLREDTLSKIVYIRPNIEFTDIDQEFIYLDFSLNNGDVIELININWSGVDSIGQFNVDSIITIYTIAGYRKAIFLSGDNNQAYPPYPTWVEGVGSLSSPIFPHTWPMIFSYDCGYSDNAITCFYRDGILVYQAEFSLACGCSISGHWGTINQNNISNAVLIYPNPIENVLNIQNTSQSRITCNLVDLNGRIILFTSVYSKKIKFLILWIFQMEYIFFK